MEPNVRIEQFASYCAELPEPWTKFIEPATAAKDLPAEPPAADNLSLQEQSRHMALLHLKPATG